MSDPRDSDLDQHPNHRLPKDEQDLTSEDERPLLPFSVSDASHRFLQTGSPVDAPISETQRNRSGRTHHGGCWQAVAAWVRGPQPPRTFRIEGVFPAVQRTPLRLLERYTPKRRHRLALLVLFWIAWLLSFGIMQWNSSPSDIPGHGSPSRLWCAASTWRRHCGIKGDCQPFANSSMAFRCPAHCGNQRIYDEYAVGDQEVMYKTLVIGGALAKSRGIESSVYRGDSFICASAVHAGFITDERGGCGVLELVGEFDSYHSTNSNHVQSIAFDSYFPQAFRFKPGTQKQCDDPRWKILTISVLFSVTLSLFTTSPEVFFWSIAVILFFTTALATDTADVRDYSTLLSRAFGNFLPACFCMAILYRSAVKRTLTDLDAQLEKTLLWLGPAWAGALDNYTFEKLPVSRLTPHDLRTQPGAIPAVIVIVLIIFAIALGQAWCFRVEGRMPKYLRLYGLMALSILALLAVPGLNLRIHHYILALLLLPGTSFQTRPSLVYQGFLIGLFINGIAKWGFDSILQTSAQLFNGVDLGSMLPQVAVPSNIGVIQNGSITFTVGPLPTNPDRGKVYDGVSVKVNDVERLRTWGNPVGHGQGEWDNGTLSWTWDRHKENLPEYFRFAYLKGSAVSEYTKAGVWLANGTWIAPK